MNQKTKTRRYTIYASIVLFFTLFLTVGLILSYVQSSGPLFGVKADPNPYTITLDSSNKVTTAGHHVQHTKKGSNVTFTYAGVNSSTSGHVHLNENGTLKNKDRITSVTGLRVSYTGPGTLKARISYVDDISKYGDYFTLVSDSKVETGSNPYYVELKAFGGAVDITSAVYEFSCVVNTDAESHDTSGSYEITFMDSGANAGTAITTATIGDSIASGANYIKSFSGLTKIFPGSGVAGVKFGSSSASGSMTINFNSTNVAYNITTIDIATAKYGSDTGSFNVYVNGSSSKTTITPSAGGSVTVNAALTSLTLETTTKRAYLCGLTLNYGGKTEPGTPSNPTAYEVGFSASDANKDKYTTNSIFGSESALVVYSLKSDGSQSRLSSGSYSYVITDAYDQVIDPTQKFPAEGIYTLTVSYSNYIPQQITLLVGEYVYITDVSAAMTMVNFTTADTLSSNLEGKLTANLEYSNNTQSSAIAYSEFAANGIGIKLLNPKGITYTITNPFGTVGTWTLKVYNLIDENMYYNISLTVTAIPVTNIAMSEASASMEVGSTHQLNATVTPSNATNADYVWASQNESVATVSESGLVTAVAVGGTTITATAQDGSGVYGSCTITVTAKPVVTSGDATMTGGTNGSTCTVNNNNGIKVGTSKAGGDMTIAIPSGSTKVSFYSAGWNSSSGSVSMTMSRGSISESSYTPTNNTGISNNSPFTLSSGSNVEDYKYEYTLSNVTANATLTLSRNSRFVVWGAKYYNVSTPVDPVYPTSISLSASSNSITIGGTTELSVTYTPATTNVKNVTYSSSNESIATVSNTGLVTGIAQGSATITATELKPQVVQLLQQLQLQLHQSLLHLFH